MIVDTDVLLADSTSNVTFTDVQIHPRQAKTPQSCEPMDALTAYVRGILRDPIQRRHAPRKWILLIHDGDRKPTCEVHVEFKWNDCEAAT